MRTVFFPALNREVSVLGFGCASLGSRISPSVGLKAAQLAFDNGVTWFDVAPPYGDGAAETLLGTFLKGRRDQVIVCSKVGISRPQISVIKQLVRPAARWAVQAFPDLRGYLARSRGGAQRGPMDPKAIRSSVETSLHELGTDYLDVLALHEPSVQDCSNPAILEELEKLLRDGYARVITIAGDTDSIAVGISSTALFKGIQIADSPYLRNAETLCSRTPLANRLFFIKHSIFGAGALARFSLNLSITKGADTDDPASLLLDYALSTNPNGVVLTSMYSKTHIKLNCARASRAVDADVRMRVDAIIKAN